MPQKYYIVPTNGEPVDPGYGVDAGEGVDNSLPGNPGIPTHPIVIPPLPPTTKPPVGIWPPRIQPGVPTQPIFIPETPDNTLPLPPGQIWPPLNPGTGIGGKVLILVLVVGVGYRWVVVESAQIWPPTATPK